MGNPRSEATRIKLDEMDKRILAALIENSRIMSKDLSRRLKVHPNTLLQRLKKLESSGVIIRYQAVVDFPKVDRHMEVMMLLRMNMEKPWEDEMRPISKMPEVVSFTVMTGDHDALLVARVRDDRHLAQFLRKIHSTKVVIKLTTHLFVDCYKQRHEYNPLKEELDWAPAR